MDNRQSLCHSKTMQAEKILSESRPDEIKTFCQRAKLVTNQREKAAMLLQLVYLHHDQLDPETDREVADAWNALTGQHDAQSD